MKRNHIISLVLLIAFVSSMAIYFRYDTGRKREILEQLAEEYPSVGIDQFLEGTVTKIDHPRADFFNDDPLQAYLSLNDSMKRRIKTGHELAKSFSLDSILSLGDRLIKKSGSDSVLIYKIQNGDTLQFSFQLRDDLGYPLKKKS
jgi:hypothetical protein